MYLQYRHLDAERGRKLARSFFDRLGILPGAGRVSTAAADCALHADRRSAGGPA